MIRLRTLGVLHIDGEGRQSARLLLHEPVRLAVFVYLAACESGFANRDRVAALFWPDSDREHGRKALRQALYRIRQLCGAASLAGCRSDVGIEPSAVWVDVRAFRKACREQRAEDALALYGGSFLEDFADLGRPELEQWVTGKRLGLRSDALRMAVRLAEEDEGRGDHRSASRRWGTAVSLSGHDERPLRRWMESLARQGAPGQALEVFHEAARRLREDLDLDPARETLSLAARIRRGERRHPP